MHIINITVRNKVAVNPAQDRYVCGNSDYIVRFDFDAEWDAYETKTARFIKEDGTVYDQVFTGSDCPVPVIADTYKIMVGVYAGNLSTTTAAYVPAKKSILCGGGLPADPAPDVYAQVMETLNTNTKTAQGTAEKLTEAFGGGALFLVTSVKVDGGWRSDRSQEEIRAAVAACKTCLLVANDGSVYTYNREKAHPIAGDNTCPTFFKYEHLWGTGILQKEAAVLEDGQIKYVYYNGYASTPNPHALIIKQGDKSTSYNGSSAVTVEIPSGIEDPGTAHQMLVSDADGKAVWTDLLAYKTTGTVELLGETVLPVTDDEGLFFCTSPLAALPENGKTYKVTYNGEVRETPCLVHSQNGVTAAILGSGLAFGLENDEDAPFSIGIPMDDATRESMGGIHLLYIGKVEFTGDLTLSISGDGTTIKKIDSDYLPDGVGKKIVLTIDADGNVTTETTFAEAWAMTDAQLANAIVIKETGSYMGNDVPMSGSAHVTRVESDYQSLQISFAKWHDWYDVLGQSDITRYINWNAGGISLSKAQTYSLPEMATDSSGATGAVYYARCINGKWQYCDIAQLKADLGLS